MFRRWMLPGLLITCALLSLLILRSVAPDLVQKQLLFFVAGGVIFVITSKVPFRTWLQISPGLYGLLLMGLVATQIIGKVTRGTTSWIPVGSFHIQPSQLAVAWVGLLIARLLAKHPLQKWQQIFFYGALVGLPAASIFLEPDLGTTAIYVLTMATIFFIAKTRWQFILGAAGLGLLTIIIGWTFLLKPYQKERVTSFLNVTEESANSSSYNAVQSVIAVGSGQVWGRGLGEGVQSHLQFLPERQTDFVFASFAEEMGLLGSSVLLGLYAATVGVILTTGLKQDLDQPVGRAGQLFAFLTAMMLTIQAGINIGMNMGVLPITGITLPLLSYGGSSILAWCFQYGCVQSLLNQEQPQARLNIR